MPRLNTNTEMSFVVCVCVWIDGVDFSCVLREQRDPLYLRDKLSLKLSKEQFEAAQKTEQEYSPFFTGKPKLARCRKPQGGKKKKKKRDENLRKLEIRTTQIFSSSIYFAPPRRCCPRWQRLLHLHSDRHHCGAGAE